MREEIANFRRKHDDLSSGSFYPTNLWLFSPDAYWLFSPDAEWLFSTDANTIKNIIRVEDR